VARIDIDGATLVVPVPGLVPTGDEAFELVRRGTVVDLVGHTGREVRILSLCATRP
jgi:hypothetical protein